MGKLPAHSDGLAGDGVSVGRGGKGVSGHADAVNRKVDGAQHQKEKPVSLVQWRCSVLLRPGEEKGGKAGIQSPINLCQIRCVLSH